MNPARGRAQPSAPPPRQRQPRSRRDPTSPPTGPIPPVPGRVTSAARALRRRAGFAVVGDGIRDPDQPGHRLRQDCLAGRHPGRRAGQLVLGGQSATSPDRRARAGGDVHRDLRARADPRRAGRPRRRCGIRAAPGHVGDRAAAGRHHAVGAGRAAAGAADAGPQPAGQRTPDHCLRLPAAAPGARLRPDVGVHGNPEHPQQCSGRRRGRRWSTTSSRSRPCSSTWWSPASCPSTPSGWATPNCWCSASAPT